MDDGVRRDVEHVAFPGLVHVEREDDVLTLHNPGHGTSLDIDAGSREWVEAILAGFAVPTTPAAFAERHPDVPHELVVLMVRSCFVVEHAELALLEHGFLRPTPTPVGDPWAWSDLPELACPGAWVVVGAPVDLAAGGVGGARQGPSEIRKVVARPLLGGEGDVIDHEYGRLYPSTRPLVVDLGDVDPEGARLDHVGARLAKCVREILRGGLRPLVLGGDHSITSFVLDELIRAVPRFGILHFDAHHDMTPSRSLSHASVFGAAIASPRVEQIVQIGLRVAERITPYARRTPCAKRTVISARDVLRGNALAVLDALPRDLPYYLTFDIDCIDAAIVRETGTPVFGGLAYEHASELVDYLARSLELLGADFVEVSGAQGPTNAAATIAASLLARCVLGDVPFEPLSSDVYTF